jgi:hypothetical protein
VAEFLFRQKTNSNGSPFLLSAFVLSLLEQTEEPYIIRDFAISSTST